jgi:hypothetical protein
VNNALKSGYVVLAFVLSFAGVFAQGTPGTSGATSGGPGLPDDGLGSGPSNTQQICFHIPDETVPPGGIAQMKLMETEPAPVTTGRPRLTVASGLTVKGIELFDPNGAVEGVAMVRGQTVSVESIFSTGTQGTDYPIMVVSLQTSENSSLVTRFPFSLDPSSTWILGSLGTATMKPISPAAISVGGSISITDVVPGSGFQPAGTVIHVLGIGFQQATQVQLSTIKASSISVISPQEIQVVLAEPAQMTGTKIQVKNPDNSQDTYFSYMRGIPLGASNEPLLAFAFPIFSSLTYSQAVFAFTASSATQFNGIAVQNPNSAPANLTFTLFSSSNTPVGSSTVLVPGGYRIMSEMSELTGMTPPPGSYMVVSSDSPVQMLGFLGDNLSGIVVPYAALSSQL